MLSRRQSLTGRSRAFLWLTALAFVALPPATASETPDLIWHVESVTGQVESTREGERAVNPASLVKIGTSLWALDRLGEEHRFVTRMAATGDVRDGVLHGPLLVLGGGDPDFHAENAFLMALALRQRGIRGATGKLLLGGEFWIGWEQGKASSGRERRRLMGRRLQAALDSRLWDDGLRQAWKDLARRRGLDPEDPPSLRTAGVAAAPAAPPPAGILLEHRSRPLIEMLRRFNCWSNNDIERLGATLGTSADLQRFLQARLGPGAGSIRLETLSGLGGNRMTLQTAVKLLQVARLDLEARGRGLDALLPVAGCDPGTLRLFPDLRESLAGSVVAKTGTLIKTDGGIVLLAGLARTRQGEILFGVAAPGSGTGVKEARRRESRWLADLVARRGGGMAAACGAGPGTSDQGASVSGAEEPAAAAGRAISSDSAWWKSSR